MQTRLMVMRVPVRIDWAELGVGESLFIPAPVGYTLTLKNNLHAAAADAGYSVVTEEVSDKGFTGVRLWRIK